MALTQIILIGIITRIIDQQDCTDVYYFPGNRSNNPYILLDFFFFFFNFFIIGHTFHPNHPNSKCPSKY